MAVWLQYHTGYGRQQLVPPVARCQCRPGSQPAKFQLAVLVIQGMHTHAGVCHCLQHTVAFVIVWTGISERIRCALVTNTVRVRNNVVLPMNVSGIMFLSGHTTRGLDTCTSCVFDTNTAWQTRRVWATFRDCFWRQLPHPVTYGCAKAARSLPAAALVAEACQRRRPGWC